MNYNQITEVYAAKSTQLQNKIGIITNGIILATVIQLFHNNGRLRAD